MTRFDLRSQVRLKLIRLHAHVFTVLYFQVLVRKMHYGTTVLFYLQVCLLLFLFTLFPLPTKIRSTVDTSTIGMSILMV